jgi:hypothetical protein
MIFSEGVDAVAIAGEVVLTGYMLQTVMRAVTNAVVTIIAILRIVLSSQEVVLCWSCLIFASARRSITRCNEGEYLEKGAVALFPREQARTLGAESWRARRSARREAGNHAEL